MHFKVVTWGRYEGKSACICVSHWRKTQNILSIFTKCESQSRWSALPLKRPVVGIAFPRLSAAGNWFALWLSSLATGCECRRIFYTLLATPSLTCYYTPFLLMPLCVSRKDYGSTIYLYKWKIKCYEGCTNSRFRGLIRHYKQIFSAGQEMWIFLNKVSGSQTQIISEGKLVEKKKG